MGQLRTGTVDLTNGSVAVVVNGVASGAEEVAVGSQFKRDNEAAIYIVASRTPASGGSLTQITLTAPYAGATGAGALYQITTDFSPGRNYPLLNQGDGDAADWITRALLMIDTDYSALVAAYPLAPGAAGSVAYATGSALAWTGAGVAGHVLISGGAGAPSWSANIAGKSGSTDALKSATTTVDVSASAAPSAGQCLVASSDQAASWATPPLATAANGLKSATTTVEVSASAAPTAGQVLTATSGTAATWQTPAGATALNNDQYITGKTSGGIDKRLIGVTPTNYVALDRDGLGIIAGSGNLQITSADGTLRANGAGVANGKILYANANSEIIGNSNLHFDGTNLAIGWAGAGSYQLDLYSKGRADRWLVGTAGSPTIHASLGYVTNGQTVLRSANTIQLLANTYASADQNSSNFAPGALNPHVTIPCQDTAKIGLGVFGAVSQTAPLLYLAKSTGAPVFAVTAAGAAYFYGSTSGSVSFVAPAVAGTQNYTLPSGYGTNGQLLTSDGAGGLSWTTVSGGGGSGTVNNGTGGQLAYYATTGTAVSGFATGATGQVLTSGDGTTPAWSDSPRLAALYGKTDATTLTIAGGSGFGNNKVLINPSGSTAGPTMQVLSNQNSATSWSFSVKSNAASRWDLIVATDGSLLLGPTTLTAWGERVVISNDKYYAAVNAAGTAAKKLLGLNASDKLSLDKSGMSIVAGSSDIAITNTTGNLLATALDGLYKQGSNGQKCEVKQLTELHTLAAGTTSDTTIQIPAGAILIAVDARVTTTIVGPSSWQYGVSVDTSRFGSGLALTAGTTNAGTQDGVRYYGGNTSIRFEGAGGAFSAGVIRVTLHYIEVTPATS